MTANLLRRITTVALVVCSFLAAQQQYGRYVSCGALATGSKLKTRVLSGLELDPTEVF